MTKKGSIAATLLAATLSVLGWGLKEQYTINNTHENRITVLEETKADKEVVNELQIQITRQTVILENQSKLMEQQHKLLREVVDKH